MRLSKTAAYLVGILTLWPFVCVVITVCLVAPTFFDEHTRETWAYSDNTDLFETLWVLHLTTAAVMVGLLAFYVVHACKNPRIAGDMRVVWVVLHLHGTCIAWSIYWFLHVRPSPEAGGLAAGCEPHPGPPASAASRSRR